MKIKDIMVFLEEKAPISLQEVYDNSGLILGDPDSNVSKVLICLDADIKALDYGAEKNCQLILSHHPAIFEKLNKFTGDTNEANILINAIKNDLALYSYHTNFDSAKGGLSELLCKKLGIENIKIIKESGFRRDGHGAGRYGDIDTISGKDFLEFVKTKIPISVIKYVGQIPDKISKVAVYNGSYDNEIIEELSEIRPDIFITGDLKYHDAQELMGYGIFTVDAGHYGTEIIFVDEMTKLLNKQFSELEVLQYKGQDVFGSLY